MFAHLHETFCPARSLKKKCGTGRRDKNCTDLKTLSRFLSVFSRKRNWQNSGCVITVHHCVHCVRRKKGQRQFTYFFSLITGIKTNMLLIIVLGLIDKLTLVSSDFDFETPKLKDLTGIRWLLVCCHASIISRNINWFFFKYFLCFHSRTDNKAYQTVRSCKWLVC